MPLDPFRIQLGAVAIDSQLVLTVVGLLVAGWLVSAAARREEVVLDGGAWWDVATAAVIGGRALWVVLHAEYYLRGPLQVLVLTDGGLHPLGLVAGAAVGVARASGGPVRWRDTARLVALGVLGAILFERAGCALTTCGGGSPLDAPWALRRGDEWRHPVALYQVLIAGVSLQALVSARWATHGFAIATGALLLIEVVGVALAARPIDSTIAIGVAAALYGVAALWSGSRPARGAHIPAGGVAP